MIPFRYYYYEESEPADYEALEAVQDTRAADDADAQRKEQQ